MVDRTNYKEVWNGLARTYESAVAHAVGAHPEHIVQGLGRDSAQRLNEFVGVQSTDEILEIGCGIGRVGEALAPQCKHWTGCDVSAAMLEYAKQRLSRFRNVSLVEVSGHDLAPIGDASMDVVYCTLLFAHLDDLDCYNYVAEAMRVLRPGGRFFCDAVSLLHDRGWQIFEQHRKVDPAQRHPAATRCTTPQTIRAYFAHAGFGDVKLVESDEWIYAAGVKR